MFFGFFPLFVIVPILELFLLFKVAGNIGFLATLLIVISTALIGVTLLKQQGLDTFMRFKAKAGRSELPVREMAEGSLLFFAGGLLLTPGLITDTIGFLLLIPYTRGLFVSGLASYLKNKVNFFGVDADSVFGSSSTNQDSRPHTSNSSKGDVIEGEYEDVSDIDEKNINCD